MVPVAMLVRLRVLNTQMTIATAASGMQVDSGQHLWPGALRGTCHRCLTRVTANRCMGKLCFNSRCCVCQCDC